MEYWLLRSNCDFYPAYRKPTATDKGIDIAGWKLQLGPRM
jgi:hypothetical protein